MWLYGNDHSPWVQAVLLGLHEKGIAHTLVMLPPLSVFQLPIPRPHSKSPSGAWLRGGGVSWRPAAPPGVWVRPLGGVLSDTSVCRNGQSSNLSVGGSNPFRRAIVRVADNRPAAGTVRRDGDMVAIPQEPNPRASHGSTRSATGPAASASVRWWLASSAPRRVVDAGRNLRRGRYAISATPAASCSSAPGSAAPSRPPSPARRVPRSRRRRGSAAPGEDATAVSLGEEASDPAVPPPSQRQPPLSRPNSPSLPRAASSRPRSA